MNIQVGSGGVRLPGFLNVDVRKVAGVDIVGDASDLRSIANGSVDVLFGHALFEHLFLGHQLAALREWKRILAANGALIVLGLPDFETIARLYLEGASGIVGPRFDLHNVYRYTHGEPEHATPPVWPVWRAADGAAPGGWIPQLHKCIFDAAYTRDLLMECGFNAVIFNYAYPGEEHALNLGFIATPGDVSGAATGVEGILKNLVRIPDVERFANLNSIVVRMPRVVTQDGLLCIAKSLETSRPVSRLKKVARYLARIARNFAVLSASRSREESEGQLFNQVEERNRTLQ